MSMKKLFSAMTLLALCLALSACGASSDENISSAVSDAQGASDGISDDISEYGLLASYDVDSGELTYAPIEIIEESDTVRIKELEAQGVELEFPNGYFVYQSNEIQLSLPVSESVSVSLLNDELTSEASNMDAVSERLEGHPPFFLCRLHIAEGVIDGIEERFVP